MNYKLTITKIDAPLSDAAKEILSEHGDNFDAALGDFTVEPGDDGLYGSIVIIAKNVAKGDMAMLVGDIESMYGGIDYYASSSSDGKQWWSTDLEDDE